MGVVLWYQIEFPDQKVKISSDVYSGDYLVDAEITISYAIGQPGTFEVNLKDLPLTVTKTLADALSKGTGVSGGVKLDIRLGYLDDFGSHPTVLAGRVESIAASTRFPPLGTKLTGHEEASFLLLNSRGIDDGTPGSTRATVSWPKPPGTGGATKADVAKHIVNQVNTQLKGAGKVQMPEPFSPVDAVKGAINDSAEDAFRLLNKIAGQFDAEILVQDGQIQFGQAIQFPPAPGPVPTVPNPTAILALITGDDSLITVPVYGQHPAGRVHARSGRQHEQTPGRHRPAARGGRQGLRLHRAWLAEPARRAAGGRERRRLPGRVQLLPHPERHACVLPALRLHLQRARGQFPAGQPEPRTQ